MKKVLVTLIFLISAQLLSSQIRSTSPADVDKDIEKDVTVVSHTVKMGETVKLISKKYLVTPLAIYKLNKAAVDGVSEGMVLQIPVPNSHKSGSKNVTNTESPVADSGTNEVHHTVSPGETLASVARNYGITVDALKAANPQAADRKLHADETLVIPSSEGLIPSNEGASMGISDSPSDYKVESGDTLSGLALKFGTSADAIKGLNPKVAKRGLRAGETIKVRAD
ncbi:muramidase family protein [Flavobacterium silvaticum]|uniref:LysM peptidoglycan-binding domain-containing protein n=1 Tax=Flavobacterium silvaticum TaxID=1852020 RepID=A0A972FLJ8_9FLAO|nr:LysM peptidoglycan-binding domain-containing protein [Flavobacterium silvaticum]NMH27872.1 LysM peptidoglycan-binding domain-containing protein [Flavobacterium silvaticum]